MKKLLFALALVPAIAGANEVEVKTVEDLYAKVATAEAGDVINVAPGTYKMTETLYVTNTLTVRSTGSYRNTVFEPADGFTGRLCLMRAPGTAAAARPVIQGITFRGTESTDRTGGQLYIQYPGGIAQDCRFTECITRSLSSDNGGAIAMEGGAFLLRSIVDHNTGAQPIGSSNNGKPCAVAGIVLVDANKASVGGLCIENCLIVQNTGVGLRMRFTTNYKPAVRNCTIADNGGYSALTSSREFNLRNNIFLKSSNRSYHRFQSFGGDSSRSSQVLCNNFYPIAPTFDAGKATFSGNVIGHDAMFVNPRAMDYHLRAGSPCIDKGTAFDGSGTTDLDGNPRTSGDAPDIGCYEYDPNYVGETRVLYVATDGDDANAGTDSAAPLATLAHALEIAEDGTDIFLAPGAYPQSKRLIVDKPVRIFGEGGRDVTFIEPAEDAGEIGLIETQHILAEIHDLTFRNGKTTMVRQMFGGIIENCRLTGYYSTKNTALNGCAWYGEWGTLYRCVIDKNFHNQNNLASIVYASGRKEDSNHELRFGLLDTCLITDNSIWFDGGKKHTLQGYAVTMTRNGTATGTLGTMQNCTVISNDLKTALSCGTYARLLRNNILQGTISVDKPAIASYNCSPTTVGSYCVTELPAFKHPGKGNFVPKVGSSVEGKANPFLFAEDDLDLAGRPRLDEDGSQNIGCYQCFTPGLMMLVK